MSTPTPSRRSFLGAAAAASTLCMVPGRVLAQAPNSKLTHAIIGVGGMGNGHFGYLEEWNSTMVAVCDVDSDRLDAAVARAKDMGFTSCKGYRDYREMLDKEQIDICHIATPPHWHALQSIHAAEAGCDIWCEKPMTRTIGEGLAVVDAVRRNGRIFRLNTWFRFTGAFYGSGTTAAPLKQIVSSGLLGWPLTVRVSHHTGFNWKVGAWQGRTDLQPEPIPANLDWDLWLGPAPYKPYNSHRCHGNFRGYWDYDGGGLGDMGQHYLDPVQYFLDKDDESPVEIQAWTPMPAHPDACLTWDQVEMTYADGCKIILEADTVPDDASVTRNQPYIEGPLGKVWPGFRLEPADLRDAMATLPEPAPQVTDFVQAVRNRQTFALNEVNGHRSCTLINLANAAIRTGRKLHFDSQTMRFIDDEGANRLIDQPYRAPWHL